jgi:hypothetical protein
MKDSVMDSFPFLDILRGITRFYGCTFSVNRNGVNNDMPLHFIAVRPQLLKPQEIDDAARTLRRYLNSDTIMLYQYYQIVVSDISHKEGFYTKKYLHMNPRLRPFEDIDIQPNNETNRANAKFYHDFALDVEAQFWADLNLKKDQYEGEIVTGTPFDYSTAEIADMFTNTLADRVNSIRCDRMKKEAA